MANLDIFDVGILFQNVNLTIEFMRGRNLLLQDYLCCGSECSKVHDISLSDWQIFQCNTCHKRYSIRSRSFWSGSKLCLTVLLGIVFFFAQGLTVMECHKLLKRRVGHKSIVQWYNYLRDVCTCYFANNPVLFGPGSKVHIDETAIGGKRKYSRGRVPKTKIRWLFGIIDKQEHKAYVEFVRKRDNLTIITRKISPGATINSDGARVYKVLDLMNYTHNTVIHDQHYVNPVTNEHTNWIENFWSNLKYKLKIVKGSQGRMVDGHIDKFLYRYNRSHEGDMFELILQDIANYYRI